eukprot:5558792-Pleurochrysis_carterae.AAC.1
MSFRIVFGHSQGSLRKVKHGGGASMRRSLLEAKLKLSRFTSCIILFECELHGRRALSNERKVRVPGKSRECSARARPSDQVGRSPGKEKPESQNGQKNLAEPEVYRGGEKRGRGWTRENRGARRRRRRVRERPCVDSVCASGWQTL